MLLPSFAPPQKLIFKPPDHDDNQGAIDNIVSGNVALAQTQDMSFLDPLLTSTVFLTAFCSQLAMFLMILMD